MEKNNYYIGRLMDKNDISFEKQVDWCYTILHDMDEHIHVDQQQLNVKWPSPRIMGYYKLRRKVYRTFQRLGPQRVAHRGESFHITQAIVLKYLIGSEPVIHERRIVQPLKNWWIEVYYHYMLDPWRERVYMTPIHPLLWSEGNEETAACIRYVIDHNIQVAGDMLDDAIRQVRNRQWGVRNFVVLPNYGEFYQQVGASISGAQIDSHPLRPESFIV